MKPLSSSTLYCLLGLMMLNGNCSDRTECRVESGFQRGFIDKATIDTLLSGGASGIRVYGVKRNRTDEEGSIMAVGISEDRNEYPAGARTYHLFDRIEGDRITMKSLDQNEACQHFFHVLFSGHVSCTADLSKADIERLMSKAPDALLVEPEIVDDTRMTLKFSPVNITSGGPETVGEAHSSPAPCPYDCDHYQTFVCVNDRTPRGE